MKKEVKVSFNKQAWAENGTYYRGCFTICEELFNKFKEYVNSYLQKYNNQRIFSNDELKDIMYLPTLNIEIDRFTGKKCVFLKLTQRDKFVSFLKDTGVKINDSRAFNSFNYYFEIQ